jgi:hypothetical protein
MAQLECSFEKMLKAQHGLSLEDIKGALKCSSMDDSTEVDASNKRKAAGKITSLDYDSN